MLVSCLWWDQCTGQLRSLQEQQARRRRDNITTSQLTDNLPSHLNQLIIEMLCIFWMFGTRNIVISTLEYSVISKYGKGVKIYKYLTILIFKYFHHCWEGRERSPHRYDSRVSWNMRRWARSGGWWLWLWLPCWSHCLVTDHGTPWFLSVTPFSSHPGWCEAWKEILVHQAPLLNFYYRTLQS